MTQNDPHDDPRYNVGGKQYKLPYERDAGVVDPQTVKAFHEKSDQDASAQSQHHTLGPKNGQAAGGDHNHILGTPYKKPLTGVTLTGAKGGNAALASVIAALVKMGATDNTTA